MSTSHTLTFSRLRANFTVDKELLGKQDPYVIFTSGNAKAQTKAIKGVGASTAEWKETYSLENFSPSSSSIIEVNVWNHNSLLPDSVIGTGTVDLARQGESSLSGSGEPVSTVLVDKKGNEVGTISFIVNGGGYRGSSSGRGNTTGTGVGAGAAGAAAGGAGLGSNTGSGRSGTVVGQGVGTDRSTAQKASDLAAAEGRTVALEDKNALGVGHPKGTTGTTGTTTGASGTNVDYDTSRGSGVTAGTGTGVTTGTGAVATGVAAGDRTVYGEREGDVIDRKYYVGTESRPQDQALVEQYREHNPYAKDYETTVQHTGRERLINSQIEALGTRERVVGQDHLVHAHPHQEIARNLPAGAMAERPGGEGWVQTKPGPVCDTNTFSITGDRTIDKERVTDLREHREFEKEFEVKTRLVGERALARGTEAEILNRERVLVDEKNKIACEGHPPAATTGDNTIAAQGGAGYTGSGAGYGTGTGTTGTGAGYGTGTGTTGTGAGYGTGTGTTGTGAGYGTGTGNTGYNTGSTGTGTGYGSGTGVGSGSRGATTGEKVASYVPGSDENQAKKGNTGYNTPGNTTTGEKVASAIPGSQENREKKAGQYA